MDSDVPQVFNWVKARSKCTPARQFYLLAEQVDSDVTTINTLNLQSLEWTFTRQNGKIIVSRLFQGQPETAVVFIETKDAIVVKRSCQGNYTLLFEAIPHVLDESGCKLEIANVPVKIWQVSQRALEHLFFG